jgi:ABC-type transporter Mla subunit MlaD
MKVDEADGLKIHRDARAGVYWRTLLGGNFYVDLDPGSRSAPEIGDDGTIPLSRTSSQVEFDQLLDSYSGGARRGIKTFIGAFEQGFSHPRAPGASIQALAPTMRNVASGVPALRGTQPGADIPTLARDGSRALGALSRSEADLAGLIDSGDTAFSVTAARRADIGSMLQQAPVTMADTRVTLGRLRGTFDRLDPVAEALRPGARQLDDTVAAARPAMVQLRRVLPVAVPFLRDIDPALRDLSRAARSGQPVLEDLNPALDRTNADIVPWLGKRDDETKLKNAWAIGPFFATLASSSETFDSGGHVQNFQTLNGPGALGSATCQTSFFDRNPPENEDEACRAVVGALNQVLGGPAGARK